MPRVRCHPWVSVSVVGADERAALERLAHDEHLLDVRGVGHHVDELLGEPDPALAVGDGVVHLLQQRRSPSRQAVDQDELPEGTGAVDRVLHELRGQVEELALGAGFGQGQVPDVAVDVEVRVVLPLGRGHAAEGRDDALVQAGDA